MRISSKLSTAFFFFFRQIGNLFGSLEIPYRFPLLLSLFSLSYVKSWKDVEEESDERKIASVDIRHRVALDTFFRAPRFVLCEDDEGKGKARVAILHSKFTIGELSITVRPRVRTSQSTNTRREFEGTRVQIVRKEKEKEDKLSCSKFHITLLITRKFLLSGIFLLYKNPAAHERS